MKNKYHIAYIYQKLLSWERSRPFISFVFELGLILLLFYYISSLAIGALPVAMKWGKIPAYFASWSSDTGWQFGPFFYGFQKTLSLSAQALLLTLIIGYGTALLRLSSVPSLRFLAKFYVQIVRNSPLLVLLYVAYFVLSPLFNLNSFYTALIVLSLFEGAYTSEIVRGAIEEVSPMQYKAAEGLGMSPLQANLLVVHPQALRNVMPVLANQGVNLIKDSALASAIGVAELSRSTRNIYEQTYLVFEPWLGVCFVYFILTFTLSLTIKILERKTVLR